MDNNTTEKLLHLSTSPHTRYKETVPSIMLYVVIALMPAFTASVFFFGIRSIILTAICITTCLLTEWVISSAIMKKKATLGDFSALVTAILLAFNLPAELPWWMAALGSVFAIGVAKMAFGGLGNNFINPALAGRAFLMASYPASMTSFTAPRGGTMNGLPATIDAVTSATPLEAFSAAVSAGRFEALEFQLAIPNLFLGKTGGCLGETSAIALLLGAILLWYKHIIGFRIPFFYIATVFILYWIFNGTGSVTSSEALIVAVFQIFSGGLMLGALFMATDMVTSPLTPVGKIIFGIGCGVLTFLIRKFGGYPEGVSYSILLMNLTVPLIDRYTRPRIYGKVKKSAQYT